MKIINDLLITNIKLPISELDGQLLLMALKELPDDVDGMKEVMEKHDFIKTDKIDQLSNSNLLFKHMLLHRISAQLLKDDPFHGMIPKLIKNSDSEDYEEI